MVLEKFAVAVNLLVSGPDAENCPPPPMRAPSRLASGDTQRASPRRRCEVWQIDAYAISFRIPDKIRQAVEPYQAGYNPCANTDIKASGLITELRSSLKIDAATEAPAPPEEQCSLNPDDRYEGSGDTIPNPETPRYHQGQRCGRAGPWLACTE